MKNTAEETTANSATAQSAQGGEWPGPAPVARVPIIAFPSVGASVAFHDALRACIDAHSLVNEARPADPNRAILDHHADEATARLVAVIDGLFARRTALAEGLAWTDAGEDAGDE